MPIVASKSSDDYFGKTGSKVVFSLRLDESVYEIVKKVAAEQKRSINAQIELFIENGLIEILDQARPD